jgi:WD40 repeat protein
VWDIPNRKELHRLPQQPLPVEGLRFSPDGKGLVSATGNWKEWQIPGVIKLWNVDTGKETATLPGPRSKMRRVAFSRDGSTLIAGGSQNEILRYELKDGAWSQSTSLTTFGDNAVVEFVGDGSTQIVSGTSDGGVTLWSTQSRVRRDGIGHRTPKPQPVTAVAVSRDGSLIATGSSAGDVHFYLTPGAPEASIGSQLAKRKIPGVATPIIEKKPGG